MTSVEDSSGHFSDDVQAEASWHACDIAWSLQRLGSTSAGLDDDEAARRLERVGPNQLPRAAPVSPLRILGRQFTSIVVLLLGAAVAVALLLGDYIEAETIAAVLLINAAIGFVTELRARQAMDALRSLEVPFAAVVRSNRLSTIPAAKIVPGDVIDLVAGQEIPADARLIAATELRTSEAALTGESLPVSKHADQSLAADVPLAERTNMVYAGTSVTAGTARAVVTATGAATELGRIGTLVAGIQEERTPLDRRLDTLGRRLVWLVLAIAGVVATLEALHGARLGLVVETGIALAVAAVPEALPAVATIALAVGLRRMARRHALVRRLAAVEALGSTTIICTDKTRTLTSGEMTLTQVSTLGRTFDFGANEPIRSSDDHQFRRVLEVAVFATSPRVAAPQARGSAGVDPVDAAIVHLATRTGIDQDALATERQTIGIVPFSSERKLIALFDRVNGSTVAYVKGAPGRIIDLCDRVLNGTASAIPLGDEDRARLVKMNHVMASNGLRVLGVAYGSVAGADESALGRLTFAGLLGFMDPPAAGVKATIARLRRAGLRTVMITGDQRRTAEAIGRELGLLSDSDQIVEGRDLQRLAAADLSGRIARASGFSRVTADQKLRIVEAFQAGGEIVAMLGDGVNDAAALKRADVGVAMGRRGTDVAKESAAVVLQDDRFETVAAAVEEGRVIYDNILKFVFYLFSCNLAEILVLLVAGVANLPAPLLPLQILWLNIVTDTFPALSLAMEPGDPDIMDRPPRKPDEAILSPKFVAQVGLYGLLISASTLAAYFWALTHAPEQAVTVSFMTLALAQIFHLGNARSGHPVLRPSRALANRYAIAAVIVSVALQMLPAAIEPLAKLFHVASLDARAWTVVLAASALTAIVGQTTRLLSGGR